ncbi:MAG: RpiB/LacA/LacB family sugar-phosphate isomerase [Cyanobacteria bacterium RI_101]|nr:RpiB/LacA/LacB family sugar-phosphate isomerase [Cyanobacteria bacterium RI_101]
MKLAVGSDERTRLTEQVLAFLGNQGHEVLLFGPLGGEIAAWPIVSQQVAEAVAQGKAEQGVLFCWTGTGAAIAANKVPGIRAALVGDSQTAQGARRWNDANILVLSLRATSEAIAQEILTAWFAEPFDPQEAPCLARLTALERKYSQPQ